MKLTNQVIFLGLLILAACLISLMPFSRTEGYSNTYDAYYQNLNNETKAIVSNTGSLNAKEPEIKQEPPTKLLDELVATNEPKKINITNNSDFLRAVTTALTAKPDTTADTAAIYEIQPQIASINTKNAQILLSEMGNPNVSYNPRGFLQYMNWYGANCPIDSNVCVNVV